MVQVKKLVDAGATVSGAIKDLLLQKDPPLTVEGFADKYSVPRGTTSEVINLRKLPTEAQTNALISEFGGDAHEWSVFLWEQSRPVGMARAS